MQRKADGLGSITSLTDSSGTEEGAATYNSFGLPTGNDYTATAGAIQLYFYAGRELDSQWNPYYYRGRYYSAVTGRFLSEDPLRFAAGNNFYSYVGNNPVNFRDPSGKDPFIGAGIGAIFGGVYGALGAVMAGNTSFRGIVQAAAIGAATGAFAGAIDPTLGLATVALGSGIIAAAGDLVGQFANGAGTPTKPVSLGSAVAVGIAGAIGGAAGGLVEGAAVATGSSELEATVVNNLIGSNIATPVGGITRAILPKRATACKAP